jgi:hypothetical protein
MLWKSCHYNDKIQWGLFDGDIERGRIVQDDSGRAWIWILFQRANLQGSIDGQEPTVSLAAIALEQELRSPKNSTTLKRE